MEKRTYDENESYPHRVVTKRIKKADFESGNYEEGGRLDSEVLYKLDVLYALNQLAKKVELKDSERKQYMEIVDYMKNNNIKIPFRLKLKYAEGGEIGMNDFGVGDKVVFETYRDGMREGEILREIDDRHFEIGSGFGVSMVKKDNIKGLAPKRMFGLFEQGGNIDDIVAG